MKIISIFQKRLAYFRIYLLNVFFRGNVTVENWIVFLNVPDPIDLHYTVNAWLDVRRVTTCFLSKYVLLSVLRRKTTEFPKQAAAARSIEQYTRTQPFYLILVTAQIHQFRNDRISRKQTVSCTSFDGVVLFERIRSS